MALLGIKPRLRRILSLPIWMWCLCVRSLNWLMQSSKIVEKCGVKDCMEAGNPRCWICLQVESFKKWLVEVLDMPVKNDT